MSKKFDVQELLDTLDSKDFEGVANCLTPDCSMIQANNPPITGRETVVETMKTIYSKLSSVRHDLIEKWDLDGHRRMIVRGTVTYVVDEENQVTLPFMDLYTLENGLLKEAISYYDPSPFHKLLGLPV